MLHLSVETLRGIYSAHRRRMPDLHINPNSVRGQFEAWEVEFQTAIDHYKRANRRPFPTWSEVLDVLIALGYRQTAAPEESEVQNSAPTPCDAGR